MPYPNYSKVEEIVYEYGEEDIYYQKVIHSLDTSKKVPEITITYSDKFNRNGIETKKVEKEMVINVKEEDEVYLPIFKNLF